jgi:hypothetical protein
MQRTDNDLLDGELLKKEINKKIIKIDKTSYYILYDFLLEKIYPFLKVLFCARRF